MERQKLTRADQWAIERKKKTIKKRSGDLARSLGALSDALNMSEVQRAAWEPELRGYFATLFVWALLPQKATKATEIVVDAGAAEITLYGTSRGLPYGSIPRMVIWWISTQAKKLTGDNRKIYLDKTYYEFLRELGYTSSSGGTGSQAERMKDQLERLGELSVKVTVTKKVPNLPLETGNQKVDIFSAWRLWWSNEEGPPYIEIRSDVIKYFKKQSMPISLDHIKQLRRSTMALDLFLEMTLRAPYADDENPIVVPIDTLMQKYGNYEKSGQGRAAFRRDLRTALKRIETIYPKLNAEITTNDLTIKKSPFLYPATPPPAQS